MTDVLTVKEAAERLGVQPRDVYRLCADGELPTPRRDGFDLVVPADAVEALAEA